MRKISWHRRREGGQGALRRALILGALALLLVPHDAPAQQFTFRQYRQQDGLANLSVTCLLQDRAGFIWMCTDNGLFRHDGADFERFGEGEGIENTGIHSAVEDAAGRLWVGTSHDLYLGDGHRFRPVRPEGRNLNIAPGLRIAALAPGRMLIIEEDQLLELSVSPKDGVWRSAPFFTPEQLLATPPLAHLSSINVDRSGRIWLGCGSGICEVEQGHVVSWEVQAGVPEDTWRSYLLDRDGRLWARGLTHLVVLPPGGARFESRDPPHGKLTADILNVPLAEDGDGRILTRSDIGLARWQQGHWEEFTRDNGLATVGISALLTSRDGAVWLGSSGRGVARWQGYGNFESWSGAQGLGDNPVWSVLRSVERGVLLGTRAGCYRIDAASHLALPCRIDGLPAGEIQLMAERADGSLWIGMTTGELFSVAAGERRAALIANLPLMRRLYVDSTDRLWICTNTDVYVVAPGSSRVTSTPLPTGAGEITDAIEDAQGAIWAAAQGGLLRWSGERWIALKIDDEHARAGFASVLASNDGWLWAGGTSHGLLHLHVEGGRVNHAEWVAEPVVAEASVYFTLMDARGWIYLGTDAGVAVFDGRVWRNFTQPDGLIWNDTDQNAGFVDTDGSVWVGTSGGLTHIKQPERLAATTRIDLRITHATLGANGIEAGGPHRFAWRADAALNLHLADLEYGGRRPAVLKVRLSGLSDEWFETRDHDLHYPGLAPGRYQFEAIAIDRDHQRSSELVRLSVEILPPWWRTLWFQLAAAAAAVALLAGAWNWRMRKLKVHRMALERQIREHEALLHRATRDALTGLWNRTSILEILAREIELAKQQSTPLAVAIIDIDHFKAINDTRGHLGGDEVLRTLGAKLASKIRTADSLGRYGGEEFLLVVPGAPPERPFLPLERLRRVIAKLPFSFNGSPISVTASFGVAWLAPADSAQDLLARADTALYSAKYGGRNRVEYAATG
jgi:diguanylate cyclase (GGDEF)-like protein